MVQKKQFHEESRGTGRLAPGQSIDRHRDDVHLGDNRRVGAGLKRHLEPLDKGRL